MSTGSVSPPQLWKIKKSDSDIPSPPLSLQLLQASKVSVLNLDVQPPQENEVTLEVSTRRRMEAIQYYMLSKKRSFLIVASLVPLGEEDGPRVLPTSGAISVENAEKNMICMKEPHCACGHPQLYDEILSSAESLRFSFLFGQAEMRRKFPESDSEDVARKLGGVLQSSEVVRDAQALLRQAHRHTEKLLAATSV